MNPRLTIIVPAGNCVDVIEDCLKSAKWADELMVVDSFSTDGTFEISQNYADRVLRHEYINSAEQKNWIIPQANNEWVFILDSDERISDLLRDEIISAITETDKAAFSIPRVNFFLGKPLLGGGYYPDRQIRLFLRDKGRYESRHVHAHMVIDGKIGEIDSPIFHYAIRNVKQYSDHLINDMTDWEASARILENRYSKYIMLDLWIRPILAFLLRFIKEKGWKDGWRGFILAVIWSKYIFVTYQKMYTKLKATQ